MFPFSFLHKRTGTGDCNKLKFVISTPLHPDISNSEFIVLNIKGRRHGIAKIKGLKSYNLCIIAYRA